MSSAVVPTRRAERLRTLLAGGATSEGFTIIELLVVILIVAVLAAIALPLFLGQEHKAVDAQAQEMARTAETTAETIAVDTGGEYNDVTVDELHHYEPALPITSSAKPAYVSTATHGASEYSLTITAVTGDEFTIRRDGTGAITRECASPLAKTGCSGGEHGTW
jgi:prepilin-type N-terminal cleavage/methylation domain-containing protein